MSETASSTPPRGSAVPLPDAALLLEVTHDGVWDWDVETGHVAFSERWCTMLGYDPDEVTPHVSFWERGVHPDDWPIITASLDPHLRGVTPIYQCEHRVRHKDGTWRWILDRGMVIDRDPDGRARRVLGSHVDVTWRVEAEAARRHAAVLAEAQVRILERIARGEAAAVVIPAIAQLVALQAPELLLAVLVPDPDHRTLRYVMAPTLPTGYLAEGSVITVADGAGGGGTAAFTRARVVSDDIATDPRWTVHAPLALAHGLKACTTVPVSAPDGELAGVLAFYRRTTGPMRDEDAPVLNLAVDLSSIVLQRDAEESLRTARERDDRFLAALLGDLHQSRPLKERGEQAIRRLAQHLEVPLCGWATVDTETETFTVEQEIRDGMPSRAIGMVVPLAGWPRFTYEAQLHAIDDSRTYEHSASAHDETFGMHGYRASLAYGLFHEGRWVGVISAIDTRPRLWTPREKQLMSVAAERIWSALRVARALEDTDRERRRLQGVLAAIPVAVLIANADGKFAYSNERLRAIWGGLPHAHGDGEHGQYRAWRMRDGTPVGLDDWALARALRTGEVSSGEVLRIARFDGSTGVVLNAAAPIHDETGAITGAVVVLEDITEQLRVAEENVQLAEISRRKSAFVSYLSHELRTPLNAILGFTELLHDETLGPLTDLQREVLTDVLSSGQHLQQLLDDVLDTARIEAGKLQLSRSAIDVVPFVADVLGTMRPEADAKRITLDVVVDRDVVSLPFAADPGRLRQILFNYLTNAIKFTRDGGRVTLQVSRTATRSLRFSVTDTGIGIAPEDQGRLFVDFEQVHSPSSHGGWGIGLALARRLVEAQKGVVGVVSTPGVGSTFWAELPLPPA